MRVTEQKQGPALRRVLTGLIVSPEVLSKVAPKWTPGCLGAKWADLVGEWAVEFYRTKKRPPMQYIEDSFRRWEETKGHDKDSVQLVSQFLSNLSDEYARERKKLNADHVVEVAARVMKTARLKDTFARGNDALEAGQVEEADAIAKAYRPVEIGKDAASRFGADKELIGEIFEKRMKPLVRYKGPLGELINPALFRGAFVAFFGRDKAGKSLWLGDLAWKAIHQNLKVAFFETGDQTRPELNSRFVTRITKRPLMASSYTCPTRIESVGKPDGTVTEAEDRYDAEDMTREEVEALYDRWGNKYGDRMRQSFHSAGSLTLSQINSELDEWERDGFVPDTIVVDYADLMSAENRKADYRHQLNEVWMGLRALSRDRSALVATASHVSRKAYDAWVIKMDHAAEDRRKWSHVTAAIGINRTAAEVSRGAFRLNIPLSRSFGYDPEKCVGVAGCLELARPAVLSSW